MAGNNPEKNNPKKAENEQQQLGAEATDTRVEALRVAEFAKFQPTYYLDEVNEVQLAGYSWRILAVADIDNSEASHFLSVMQKWTQEAETIIPPIDHTEIVNIEDKNTTEATAYSDSTGEKITHVRRRLIPKRKSKDRSMIEDVIVSKWDNDVYARFIPRIDNADEIPFFYPKAHEYAFGYIEIDTDSHDISSQQLIIVIRELSIGSATATAKQKLVWRDLIKRLYKWTVTERFGYQKRVLHDVVVDYKQYTGKYQMLKSKYAEHWVANWPERTDPKKFVYEDIAIASWIICVWEKDCASYSSLIKPTFVDVGCGNGLLVYILNMEGFSGYGIDQCSRKVWRSFGNKIDLRAETIAPYDFSTDASWIIGNHADELVPWIPIISARTPGKHPNFIIIPCCPHDLSGKKIAFPLSAGESKYHAYVQYISDLALKCGYKTEKEFLRIPSTKNVAIIGRPQSNNSETDDAVRDAANMLARKGKGEFVARVPDSVKNEIRLIKAQRRKYNS